MDCPELSLVHVALVQLSGGGSVLGLRFSHLLGDWGSTRVLLRSISSACTQIMGRKQQQGEQTQQQDEQQQQQGEQQQQQQHDLLEPKQDIKINTSSSNGVAAPEAEHAASRVPIMASLSSSSVQGNISLPPMVPAAPLLNHLVLTARQQLPEGFQPSRLKLLEPRDAEVFAKLAELSTSTSSSGGGGSGRPKRLTYHVLPARILQLKQEAAAAVTRTDNSSSSGSTGTATRQDPSRVFTSHNVLLAAVVRVFCSLPGRAGVPHDVGIAADMRGRVPPQYCQQQQQKEEQRKLAGAVGNFFCSAILEDCVAQEYSLGELVQRLHDALHR